MARWAIIGAGDVVQRHVGPGLLAAGQQIAAIWSPRKEQRDAVAARFAASAATSAEQAIAAADAVYVCTPVDCHTSYALAALQQDRHVVVEKPLGLGLGRIDALRQILEARPNLAFRVAYYRRFWPLITQLRRIIVSEPLGQLRHVEIDFAQPYLPLAPRPNWRLDPARAGGGIIADAGCHRLDYLVALLGWPVHAEVSDVHLHGEAVESQARLSLAWPGETTGEMRLSWLDDACDRLTLQFTGGQVEWNAAQPAQLVLVSASGRSSVTLVHPDYPIEPMVRHFAGAMERCRDGLNPLERNTVIAEALRFDDLLRELIKQAAMPAPLAMLR